MYINRCGPQLAISPTGQIPPRRLPQALGTSTDLTWASVPHTLLKTNKAPWGPLVLESPHDDRTVLQVCVSVSPLFFSRGSWGSNKLGSSRPVPSLSVCSTT